MVTQAENMAYVCREPECGCATIIMVDSEIAKKENAREVSKAIRDGMTVERVSVDEARAAFSRCAHWNFTARGKRIGRTAPATEGQS